MRRAFIHLQLRLLPLLGYTISLREFACLAAILAFCAFVLYWVSASLAVTACMLIIMLFFVVLNCMIGNRSSLLSEPDEEGFIAALEEQKRILRAKLQKEPTP